MVGSSRQPHRLQRCLLGESRVSVFFYLFRAGSELGKRAGVGAAAGGGGRNLKWESAAAAAAAASLVIPNKCSSNQAGRPGQNEVTRADPVVVCGVKEK